jgi:enamine deaminase RidA (YjgF/YER057c/UK114 family)
MDLDVRGVQSPQALELYLTAPSLDSDQQASALFDAVRAELRRHGAWIALERIFAPPALQPRIRAARDAALSDLADGVEPTCLAVADAQGRIPGLQIYAIAGVDRPRTFSAAGSLRARLFAQDDMRWLTACGLSAPARPDGPSQARGAFEEAENLLRHVGADLRSVARTWIFIDRILDWYGPFNEARSTFFRQRGLLGPRADGRLPASTGIGVSPASGARIAIDVFAAIGPDGSVQRFHAAGKQRSAFEYGSAFARGATARTPAGTTVFVSGTAAIDMTGATCHINDIDGQIQMTLENTVAVLGQLQSCSRDVVQAMAYCATPAVEAAFRGCWQGTLPWPWVIMQGDVCRSDLLFEVEATACPGSRRF